MSTSAPISIIQNGLVLSYDTYNIKSYRGEPTTNLEANPINFSLWSYNTSATANFDYAPDNTLTATRVVTVSFWGSIIPSPSNSTVYTWSVYLKSNTGANQTIQCFFEDNGDYGGTFTATNFTVTPQWGRFSLSATSAASTSSPRFSIRNGDLIAWGIQLEQKNHMTQFTTGTRTNANGLVDLTGNNSITLSAAGYDSGANITLNGTSNYIQVRDNALIRPSTGKISVIAWFKSTSVGVATSNIVYNKENAWEMAAGGGVISHAFYPDWAWRGDIPYNLNQWYFTAVTYDQVYQKVYVNGDLRYQSSVTGDMGNFSSDLGIGARGLPSSPGSYFAGQVPILNVYNRALSQSEVLQIYNSTKSRFGL